MPPSPSLSTRMAMVTYLTLVITISVHTIRDNTPSTVAGLSAAGEVQHSLERVERAGSDVAEHHAERRKPQRRNAAGRNSIAFLHEVTAAG